MTEATTRPFYADSAARLHMTGGAHGFVVVVAATDAEATPETVSQPGAVAALLTHDRGVSWPNAKGEALARDIIATGGVVALGFATLGDALACQQRIRQGRR